MGPAKPQDAGPQRPKNFVDFLHARACTVRNTSHILHGDQAYRADRTLHWRKVFMSHELQFRAICLRFLAFLILGYVHKLG